MQKLIEDARAIYQAGVQGVQADVLLSRVDWEVLAPKPLQAYNRVFVIGMGKAAMAMASSVELQFESLITAGCAVVPYGYAETLPYPHKPPRKIDVLEAAHPVPDWTSEEAAEILLDIASRCEEGDLLLVLISGGGSSLTTRFADDITVEDGQAVVQHLLRAGADIRALNTVRKHISLMGGGRLAKTAMPAHVCALVISDVVGDDLSVIASGPTVGDPTHPADAIRVLRAFDIWDRLPASVTGYLQRASEEASLDTPHPSDPLFDRVTTKIIGTNRHALDAACAEATRQGYHVTIHEERVEGEARIAGQQRVDQLLASDERRPHCMLWGGETTVTVKGKGLGGRNQELVLGAALAMDGRPESMVLLSGGTDGIDGPTDASGAWATPSTIAHARRRKRDPRAYLEANDAYTFFLELKALLKPGPTHTNVMDMVVGLIE